MAQLGADDVQVDELAVTFDSTAKRLIVAESTISSLVRTVVWTGGDADRFRDQWSATMRPQLCSVSDRIGAVAKDLRMQAAAQRQASAGDLAVPSGGPSLWDELRQLKDDALRRLHELSVANAWADGEGRRQLRDLADASEADQLAWWKGLTDDQRAALLRNRPGELFGMDGLPADVRAEARSDYIDSVRADLEISSTEDKIKGELTIAWVDLGVEGTAGIIAQADGKYRVDLALDGEIGANVGSKNAKGNVGIGAGVAQSYEFDSQADAEAFVDGLYDKLTPDVSLSWLAGPGAVMASTVDDVVGYLGDHSDQRTSFEGELRLDGDLKLDVGAAEVNINGEAGARYNFDSHETTVFLGGSIEGKMDIPSTGDGTIGSGSLSADVEVKLVFDEHGTVTALDVGGSLGGEGSVGIEQFLNGTSAGSANPETLSLEAAGGGKVRFDASLDMQDPYVQQAAADLINNMGTGGVTLSDLQGLMRESEVQIQIDVTSGSSESWDIGIASLEISETTNANAFTWVKPAGGEFTRVTFDELREDRSDV